MFDYRSLVIDDCLRLFPFSVRESGCTARTGSKNNNKKWTSNMPKIPTNAVAAASAACVSSIYPRLLLMLLGLSVVPTQLRAEGFIDDAHGILTLRNY